MDPALFFFFSRGTGRYVLVQKSKTLPPKKKNAKEEENDARWTLNGLFRKGTSRERRKELVKRGIIKNNYFGSPIQDIIKNEKVTST